MKIKIKTDKEIEIELPIFKKEVGSTYFSITKVSQTHRTEITIYKEGEFSIIHFDCNPKIYLDGSSGVWGNCTEIEFEESLREAIIRSAALQQTWSWKSENVEEVANTFFPHEVKDENL